ncbi:bile acid:sodium symporter family protein [Lutimaribacter marinistellae]|uniref:Bile acid:sodium symporter family protein n=1 Tax=Lutimaribacter marinistellae TaxID=1820329 RepID=A0ABV7TKP6_9RHOB
METSVPFDTTAELLIYAFVSLAMLCIGMNASLRDFGVLLLDHGRTARTLVANIVIPPIVAFLLISLLPMNETSAAVLFLLAFAPGGINALQFSTKAPGQMALAGELLFLLSLLGLITAPVAAQVILASEARAGVPGGELMLRAIGLVAVPLAIGAAIRLRASNLAETLYKPAMLVSTLSFVAAVLLSLSVRQDALATIEPATLVAMTVFILALMAAGWVLGGPNPKQRQVLAAATNLRNVGLVYVLVDGCCEGGGHSVVVLAFIALMVPANLLFTAICAKLSRR